jgi:hypothetical protein
MMRLVFGAALAVAMSLGTLVQGSASAIKGTGVPLAFDHIPPVLLVQYKSSLQIECEERGKRRGYDGGEFQSYVRRCMAREGGRYEEQKSPRQIECEERGKRRGYDGGEFQAFVRYCMGR